MTVVIQRRNERNGGYGQDGIVAYEYDRAYRLDYSIVGVELVNGPEHPGCREFMNHSFDEVVFDTAEVVTREAMLEDLGAEQLAGRQLGAIVVRYE